MPHRIALVVFPGFQLLDAAGPVAVFEVAEAHRPGSYRWRIVAPEPGLTESSSGVQWQAQPLPRAGSVDTLMLAGGDGVDAVIAQPALNRWLARTARTPERVASVCSGSLWLAAAGLLDGRAATTHWSRTRRFERDYPQVKLQPDRIFVRDGRFWSSAGITAGIDLALAIVAQDHGETLARQVAQQLVVYYRRPGGQSQFSPMLTVARSEGRFASLLEHVRTHLSDRHPVEALAARACMSPRNFARAFVAETGSTPAKVVERIRADAARAALQSGTLSVQAVAAQCGYANPEQMRRSFLRRFGVSPSSLRSR